MTPIRNLEIHLAHGCNLACESCSHYSNHAHKGIVPLEEADAWMQLWNRRLAPRAFSLLGGEPSIHPQFAEFIELARQNWPRAQLRIVTNGFFLHRHARLPLVLRDDPDAILYLSIHHRSAEYLEKIKPALELLSGWVREHGIRAGYYESETFWRRQYRGFGAQMSPFDDGRPRESWERCLSKHCPQLFEGRIWKCAPLAYLPMQAARYSLSDSWRPYLNYQPLAADCSDEELREFFAREDETYCGMCPANSERFELPNPLVRQA